MTKRMLKDKVKEGAKNAKAKASHYKGKAKKAGAAVGVGFAVLGLYLACKKQMDKALKAEELEAIEVVNEVEE